MTKDKFIRNELVSPARKSSKFASFRIAGAITGFDF
jgi:hypothetical protein